MPITLVLDQSVPRDAAGRLRDLGYDCVHAGEAGMSMAADEAILSFALRYSSAPATLCSVCQPKSRCWQEPHLGRFSVLLRQTLHQLIQKRLSFIKRLRSH